MKYDPETPMGRHYTALAQREQRRYIARLFAVAGATGFALALLMWADPLAILTQCVGG